MLFYLLAKIIVKPSKKKTPNRHLKQRLPSSRQNAAQRSDERSPSRTRHLERRRIRDPQSTALSLRGFLSRPSLPLPAGRLRNDRVNLSCTSIEMKGCCFWFCVEILITLLSLRWLPVYKLTTCKIGLHQG